MTCGILCVMRREGRGVLHLDKYSPPKENLFEGEKGEKKKKKKKRKENVKERELAVL